MHKSGHKCEWFYLKSKKISCHVKSTPQPWDDEISNIHFQSRYYWIKQQNTGRAGFRKRDFNWSKRDFCWVGGIYSGFIRALLWYMRASIFSYGKLDLCIYFECEDPIKIKVAREKRSKPVGKKHQFNDVSQISHIIKGLRRKLGFYSLRKSRYSYVSRYRYPSTHVSNYLCQFRVITWKSSSRYVPQQRKPKKIWINFVPLLQDFLLHLSSLPSFLKRPFNLIFCEHKKGWVSKLFSFYHSIL